MGNLALDTRSASAFQNAPLDVKEERNDIE